MIPETPFKIDGIEYNLRFSAKTVINIEKALGKPIGSLVDIDESNVSIELFSIFFTESVRDINGKKLQPKEADDLLDTITIDQLMEIVQTGFNQLFPKLEEGSEPAKN